MSLSFEWLVNDHRRQFGVIDTVKVLVRLYDYTTAEARALVRRLREQDQGPLDRARIEAGLAADDLEEQLQAIVQETRKTGGEL